MGTYGNRKSSRYYQTLPVTLDGGSGVTRDISVTGVYFVTGQSFTAGQTIDFSIMFDQTSLGEARCMKCRGEIVRVEVNGTKLGVASKFHSFKFE